MALSIWLQGGRESRTVMTRNRMFTSVLALLITGISLPSAQSSPITAAAETDAEITLDDTLRHLVIEGAITNLKQHYVDQDLAPKIAETLLANEEHGGYRGINSAPALANLLTRQMRDISQDNHLELIYSRAALPEHPSEPTAENLARYRSIMERENCTFEKVEILPNKIGYLKLNSFPDVSVCQRTAQKMMARLSHAEAIIFDLRDNTGGFPDMVALITAYLFDHPEYLYNPRENVTEHSWTASPVPGNKLADKAVYVLTSSRTLSGAEQFSYNLKMLKRATLVGETTGGAAHAGNFYRIDEHFGIAIPEVKPINPYSKADWEGTGVQPDIRVKAKNAMATAERLAESRLRK